MDKDAARQGKDLCLILESTEGRRKDQTVKITTEVGADTVLIGVVIVFKAETLIVDQQIPIHFICHNRQFKITGPAEP